MTCGWIKLHRKIKDHWLWQDAEKLKWWISILIEVNHEGRKVLIKGKLFDCQRGQSLKSLDTWAKEWRTTKKTVRQFFLLLQEDGMLTISSVTVSTRITVCNYESYQDIGNAPETQSKRKRNAKETQPTPKQEGEEVKNDKNVLFPPESKNGFSVIPKSEEQIKFEAFRKWVDENAPRVNQMLEPFTLEQWQKATKQFGSIGGVLKKMHNYQPLLKANVSAYLTLCNWMKRELEKQSA